MKYLKISQQQILKNWLRFVILIWHEFNNLCDTENISRELPGNEVDVAAVCSWPGCICMALSVWAVFLETDHRPLYVPANRKHAPVSCQLHSCLRT